MLCVQGDINTQTCKRELKDYPLNKLYIALKIILLSSSMGMPAAFAVDLPSTAAGCLDGVTECKVTTAQGTDFTVTSNITSTTNGVSTDSTVVNSTFTVNSGVSVIAGTGSAGFEISGGSGNTLTNNGTIQGGYGVNFSNVLNATLVNNGTISSNGTFNALGGFGTGFTLTNNEGATLTASHTVVAGSTSGGGCNH